jgi:hypothetical protein
MNEKLLQFIWLFRHYHSAELFTLSGEPLQVIHPGQWNKGQGPDFLNARIRIGDTLWAGHVELHVRASDWDKHGHSSDPQYDNVILHVVWQQDSEVCLPFPVLELSGRVPLHVMERCARLIESGDSLSCSYGLKQVDELTLVSWKERLIVERLESRTIQIRAMLDRSGNHWGEVFWQLMCRSYGLHLNADAFERLASGLSMNLIRKVGYLPLHAEALLFGQASLLEKDFRDEYPRALRDAYSFLASKYSLGNIGMPPVFLRMRPVSFPTVRIGLLAEVLRGNKYLFSVIMEEHQLSKLKNCFDHKAGDYWDFHYVFDELSSFLPKHPGEVLLNSIVLNTIIPIVFAYGHINRIPALKDRALCWLNELPAEKNRIVREFSKFGIVTDSASDSQSLLQLHKEYCCRKRCLDCAIGAKVIGGGV